MKQQIFIEKIKEQLIKYPIIQSLMKKAKNK